MILSCGLVTVASQISWSFLKKPQLLWGPFVNETFTHAVTHIQALHTQSHTKWLRAASAGPVLFVLQQKPCKRDFCTNNRTLLRATYTVTHKMATSSLVELDFFLIQQDLNSTKPNSYKRATNQSQIPCFWFSVFLGVKVSFTKGPFHRKNLFYKKALQQGQIAPRLLL